MAFARIFYGTEVMANQKRTLSGPRITPEIEYPQKTESVETNSVEILEKS